MVSKKGSGGRPKKQLIPLAGETIIYKTYDTVGMAKVIANYADDLPRADVAGTEHTVRVKSIGASYGYNVQELKASAGLGTNLPTRKGEAARRSIEVKLNQIAMTGDAAYNLHRPPAKKLLPTWMHCGMRCACNRKGCILRTA